MDTDSLSKKSVPVNRLAPPTGGLAERLAEQYPDLVLPPWRQRGKGFGAVVAGHELFVCRTKAGDRWCIAVDGEWFQQTFETSYAAKCAALEVL